MKTLRDYIDLVNERFDQALSEKVTLNPDGTVPPTQTVNGVTMNAPANAIKTGSGGIVTSGNGAAVTSGTPAPAPDAVAAAKAKLTPSQLKWLGGADATDSAIMARMPKPQPGEQVPGTAPKMTAADQEDADMGAAMKANQAAAIGANQDAEDLAMGQAMTQNAAQAAALASGAQDDATGVDAAVAANAASNAQAANGVNAQGQNVTMPNGINPETGEPSSTMTAAAPAPVAQAGQAKPAAGGKVPPQPTLNGKPSTGPKGQEWLKKYGATNNPDGTPKAAGAGAGRGGQGGPTAAQAASAQPAPNAPGQNARDDLLARQGKGTTPGQNARDDLLARQTPAAPVAKEGRTARNDHAFIDELNAMRSIAGLPTKNKW